LVEKEKENAVLVSEELRKRWFGWYFHV